MNNDVKYPSPHGIVMWHKSGLVSGSPRETCQLMDG